jgi:hypothetical protein
MLGRLFRWDPDLSYKVLLVVYSLGCVAAIALYVGEKRGSRPQTEWIANLNGVYITFVPYVPCLIWLLVTHTIRRRISFGEEVSLSLLAPKKDQ